MKKFLCMSREGRDTHTHTIIGRLIDIKADLQNDVFTKRLIYVFTCLSHCACLYLSVSELDSQLRLLENLLLSLPAVLICNHEQRQEAELIEEVTEVRVKLEEKLSASEEEKVKSCQHSPVFLDLFVLPYLSLPVCPQSMNVKRLRVSLGEEELLSLSSREELRQQQLHSDICSLHLELQVGRGGVSVTPVSTTTCHACNTCVFCVGVSRSV